MSEIRLNERDLDPWPDDRLGWLATYNAVRRVDDHLRARGLGVVVTSLPAGCAGGGWVPSAYYPGITKERA